MVKYERTYQCPFCGEAATYVAHTQSLTSCIIRTRKCRYCGHSHDTAEVYVDIGEQVKNSVNCKVSSHEPG